MLQHRYIRTWCGTLVCAVALGSSACGPRRMRTDLPREERGVAVLTEIVIEYKDALRSRDFEQAADLLEELEEGVKNADGITRSHPDFEDVARAAQKARPALETMMRKDKVEKLIARIQTEVAEAEKLSADLEKDGPTSKRLAGLRDATLAIQEMLAEGKAEGYQDDKTYSAMLPDFAQKLTRYQGHVSQFGWILRLIDELGPALKKAVKAEEVLAGDSPADNRLRAGRAAIAAFEDCKSLTAKYREEPGYSDTLKIETAIGEVSIDEAGLTCEFRRAAVESKVATLEWQNEINTVARAVTEAMTKLETAKGPEATLAVTGEAVEALAECSRALRKTNDNPGFDASIKFDTALGKMNALRLKEACKKESDKIGSKNPTLQWRSGLNRLRKRAGDAKTAAAAARKTKVLEEKVEHLSEAVGGYQECMEQARFLGQGKGIKGAKPTSREKAEIKKLGKSCYKHHGKATKLLKKAKKAAAKKRRR